MPDLAQTKQKPPPPAAADAAAAASPDLPAFYLAKDNETPRKIALKLGIDAKVGAEY
eukprot:SAG22_NODE_763_length_7406_cov_22.129054_7_plen_57_part_00